ncbi:hypothetical protein PAP18089_05250 [Pandoraea apista]|uniref:Uncharacterized protein n=1 Tax=Pandoraea apista TaxID=93218 RepID=A0A5E5PCB6_9BURK|nr:hypothetical protein LMG16407_03169 [Pandoraea apista]VVG74237.1 hypothetical protein PAP18089_05250 [Pandoraea apista]
MHRKIIGGALAHIVYKIRAPLRSAANVMATQ